MSQLLRVGALDVTFALVFTVLALAEVVLLRRQRRQLLREIERSRLEARSLAELSIVHARLQRQYGQARALIDLITHFNQVKDFDAVLDWLGRGLTHFYAGDDVSIWIRRNDGGLHLAVGVCDDVAPARAPDEAWLNEMLAWGSGYVPPSWQQAGRPWMAAPLLDWRGFALGVVVLTSRRRAAYGAEDGDFLRVVLGHAATAMQSAARYEVADRLSRLDALTGLGNRGDFDRALQEDAVRARHGSPGFSLLLADVDHFKEVNDLRGHPEGDRALRQVAQLIGQAGGDTARAFRIGGEEFAVLLTDGKAAAFSAATLLCARVGGEAFFNDGGRLTLSIGVASLPEDARDPLTLMRAADRALYRAKAGGRNRVQAA